MVKEKIHSKENSSEATDKVRDLILYNDDFNTFDFVIETLIELCKHDAEQAEQCALVAHFKGKCGIKSGTLKELRPMNNELNNRGISTVLA